MGREIKVAEKKLKNVKEVARLIEESNSIVMVSIKNLPSSQFQLIKKKLRDQVVTRVLKKSTILKAIDSVEKGVIKNFKRYIKEDTALMFSKMDPFELSSMLSKNKSRARAKAGQVVEEDVVIEPGPTELVPGPIISELSSLGLKFAIEDGKINIKEKKIIVKAGEKVNEEAASIMAKLDMKPVSVGLEPLIAYDSKEEKIFENIKIELEKIVKELKDSSARAMAFAVKLAYPCRQTIRFLLAKAKSHEEALNKFAIEKNE